GACGAAEELPVHEVRRPPVRPQPPLNLRQREGDLVELGQRGHPTSLPRRKVLGMRALSGLIAGVVVATSATAVAAARPAAGPGTSRQEMRAVVHEWSARLNANDNAGI